MTPAPLVEVATRADLDRLAELEQICEGTDAWSRILVADSLEGGWSTTTWLVARAGEVVVGYAVLAVVDDIAELQRIGVDPGERRRGVARVLLDGVVERSRRAGAVRLLLEVREDNGPALALYARAGFAEIARRRSYYADGTTAIVMEQDLPGQGR
jgi:[ribosomal protein S18]-alanine N-acetyltransferase